MIEPTGVTYAGGDSGQIGDWAVQAQVVVTNGEWQSSRSTATFVIEGCTGNDARRRATALLTAAGDPHELFLSLYRFDCAKRV